MSLILSLILRCFLFFCLAHGDPGYREHLDLQPLEPSSLLASFQFWSNASLESYQRQHFRYIPRSLGQILQHTKTNELHLRFSTGRWDDEAWGERPRNGAKEGGTGVELWAWVEANSEEQSFARWTTLNHALSGLFCASLNFIDSTRTTRPRLSFSPSGQNPTISADNLYLLHGTLPREVVCTENLTPFLKLLPCKGKAGIANLLDGHKLFDASWQTMAIDFSTTCTEDGSCSVEMEQSIDMVLDTDRSKRPRDNPIPRPVPNEALLCDETKEYHSQDRCFPSDLSKGQSWTLAEIFGRRLRGSCLAHDIDGTPRESLCLHVPTERQVHAPPEVTELQEEGADKRCYILDESGEFEMVLSHIGPQSFNNHTRPALYASRSVTGYGQERGGVQSRLTNPDPYSPVSFVYFESLPWFMKPYLHTLTARLSTTPHTPSNDIIQETFYRPALDRHRGTQLELVMTVPPASTVILSYHFDKAILRYTEYPPDANRGFDVAPAVIRLLSSSLSSSSSSPSSSKNHSDFSSQHDRYIRTTSLLLPLPTPDFSMPYNVIILTSTVMALAFGSIFNFLVRRLVAADEVEAFDLSGLKNRVREKVQSLVAKVKGKTGAPANGNGDAAGTGSSEGEDKKE